MTDPYYTGNGTTVLHGDCLTLMRDLPDASVDSIVTDPPYGLGFMGKAWDALPPGLPWAQECLRVLKPGGHLLAFGGTRTWHRLAVAVEDAGFEIRDSIAWLYGSGFPKSLDVSKAIDKAAGAERAVIGSKLSQPGYHLHGHNGGEAFGRGLSSSTYETRLASSHITAPATDAAKKWDGWGTALKPAFEPIVVGRKPLVGTVAANVQAHGVGGLNIDACRVGGESTRRHNTAEMGYPGGNLADSYSTGSDAGRWPTNVALDGAQAVDLDQQTDKGGGSRFFPTFKYQAKAPASERPNVDGVAHPTVKPLALMRWLVRLVTPAGGTVLEPFAGSGTTAEACALEGFRCIAIERDATYLPLIKARLDRPYLLAEADRLRGELAAVRGTIVTQIGDKIIKNGDRDDLDEWSEGYNSGIERAGRIAAGAQSDRWA